MRSSHVWMNFGVKTYQKLKYQKLLPQYMFSDEKVNQGVSGEK